jgi:hypothetical protein
MVAEVLYEVPGVLREVRSCAIGGQWRLALPGYLLQVIRLLASSGACSAYAVL